MMFISESNLAALTGTSLATTHGWAKRKVFPSTQNYDGTLGFNMEELESIPEVAAMNRNNWDEEMDVKPSRTFNSLELFAGGGGLALGMEKAGFNHVLLNEFDTAACNTLRVNRPEWNIIEGDVRHIDFSPLKDKIDFLSGGFPCQAFSFAGKQGGFNDVRGTLFFEMARAIKEIRPKVFLGENVKGLASHDNGKTFKTICNVISELGYTLIEPRVLKALMYQVPQKRERIILIAIRNDLATRVQFNWPSPYKRILTLRDALYKSVIFDCDVPESDGMSYPSGKRKVLELVPQGGDWRDLPEDIAREYMGGSWLLGGGKTGMARRLSLDEPSLTLTCSPCQKQTERCHPIATRPLSIREYARIQTFPDNWIFQGTLSDQYKQIGNAVPVNLAWAIGRSLIRLFNDIQKEIPEEASDCREAIAEIMRQQDRIIVVKDKNTQTSTIKKGYRQLNIFDLFDQYANSPIIENQVLCDSTPLDIQTDDTRIKRNAIISFVKDNLHSDFEDRSANIYFTGKRFPATINLKELLYFIPYIKGKGIRDLYAIRQIRVGSYLEGMTGEKKDDFRLVFEIQFLKKIFNDYKMTDLEIWRTYTNLNLAHLHQKMQ